MDQIPAEVLSRKGVGIVRGRKVQQLGTPCVAHCRSVQDDPDSPLGRLQSNAPTPLRPHSIHGFAPGVLLCVLHRLSLTRPVEVRRDRRSNLHGRRWCAWQESNLLPLAPQASALSGELQARAHQFSRASTAAVPALKAVASRFVNTTRATKTFFCQQARRTGLRSYVQEVRPSPVPVPRTTPGGSSPGTGGVKPRIPACHARSAWPCSANATTRLAADWTFLTAASSAVQADGSAAKRLIAASVAPSFFRSFHCPVRR